MPYWTTVRYVNPRTRSEIETAWTQLPEDVNPNEAPGQRDNLWSIIPRDGLPRTVPGNGALRRVFLGLPGETPDGTSLPTLGLPPPTGWVWHTDATFPMADGRSRRYWVRTPDGRRPSEHGYPAYQNRHGWVRWRENSWAPNDCRRHPEPVPGQWSCAHCGVLCAPTQDRHETTIAGVPSSICGACAPTIIRECSECHTRHYYGSVHRGLNFRTGAGQYDTMARDVCVPCWERLNDNPETRYRECACCSYYCQGMAATRSRNGHHICQFCAIANTVCTYCGRVVRRDRLMRNGTRCQYCQARTIRSYGDRTANNLGPFGVSKVKLKNGRSVDMTIRYGVELELEVSDGTNPEERAQEALDRIGEDFAVTKHDGSLREGYELVTAPAPLEEHRARFERLLSKRLRGISCESGRGGMHVHVSRAPLSQLQIGKLLVFINDTHNRQHIKKLAGRDSNGYCKSVLKQVKDVHRDNGDRFQSINLTNRHTIEFRIFKATTNLRGVLKNIEFCAACVDWAGQASMQALTWADFAEYVGKTPKYYPNLAAWMRTHGYIKKPKAPKPPLPESESDNDNPDKE